MPLNIALIGFGYWGPNIAKKINLSDNMNLYAICDLNPLKLERARDKYELIGAKFAVDYTELLQDKAIDAFAIATATHANHRIALDIARAGHHLFIEKPMTANSGEAVEVAAVARQAGVIVHVDHIMVYNNIIRHIKDMIDRGDLGELLYYDVSRMNLGPIRKDVGAMQDFSVHDLAILDYLLDGEEPDTVNAVSGAGCYGKHGSLTYLTLKYRDFVAHLKSSWVSPVKERRIIIGGTKKMLVFDDVKISEKLTVYDSGIELSLLHEYG